MDGIISPTGVVVGKLAEFVMAEITRPRAALLPQKILTLELPCYPV